MISAILFTIWLFSIIVPIIINVDYPLKTKLQFQIWLLWGLMSFIFIIPIFTGIKVKNNEGQYRGYIVAVEKNGAIFKGWNIILKTELESSNEDIGCIDRDNPELINRLKEAVKNKENLLLEYEGVWQYAIGECPNSNWKVIKIL